MTFSTQQHSAVVVCTPLRFSKCEMKKEPVLFSGVTLSVFLLFNGLIDFIAIGPLCPTGHLVFSYTERLLLGLFSRTFLSHTKSSLLIQGVKLEISCFCILGLLFGRRRLFLFLTSKGNCTVYKKPCNNIFELKRHYV